jgi:Fur family ferric uptake transcriptional regulator
MVSAAKKPGHAVETTTGRYDIEQACIQNGLKMTTPRRVISRVLSEVTGHPDVEELHRLATLVDQRISLATVYRTVRLFEQRGILERRDLGSKRARYEISSDEDHYHLIDRDTGDVIEFADSETEALMRRIAARHGFSLESMKIELFGRRLESTKSTRKRGHRQAENVLLSVK